MNQFSAGECNAKQQQFAGLHSQQILKFQASIACEFHQELTKFRSECRLAALFLTAPAESAAGQRLMLAVDILR
jgi:hypothetical protein